ncbi:hypothetical protein BX666DRAFT_1930269 [Dichotomocladium elegans]|nr:hypothetical protein BX666DRAFT_1930269 [Dichotomocladium elegans]
MSNDFPQSYKGPRPLAVKEIYSRLRGSSKANSILGVIDVANPEYFASIAAHFKLKNDMRPGMVFEEAPRTKKLHNELQEDLTFLYRMREIWLAKLAQLEMDYEMLRDMSLNRPEDAQMIRRQQPQRGHQRDRIAAVEHRRPTNAGQQESRSGSNESPTALLEDLEEFFPLDSDEEDSEGNGNNAEDDERARQALTLLLAQYGDEF